MPMPGNRIGSARVSFKVGVMRVMSALSGRASTHVNGWVLGE